MNLFAVFSGGLHIMLLYLHRDNQGSLINHLKTIMQNNWPILNHPPVIAALFQLKFDMGKLTLSDFTLPDRELRKSLPKRNDNFDTNIDVQFTTLQIGTSKISGTSNTKIQSYTYFSDDQKCKLTISEGVITYFDERPYVGWNSFSQSVSDYLKLFSTILSNSIVNRISIRFINQFVFDSFENPIEYFNTLISATQDNALKFPVAKYGFRLLLNISPDTYSIVNQNLEQDSKKYIYLFDIDVLKRSNLIFDIHTIESVLSELREAKNNIFFNNVTKKTIDLCN